MLSWSVTRTMAISEQIGKDIITAMKARETLRLETLRMAKAAFKNKEIDKREALTEAEELQVLQTMVKQRKEAAEQFAKGNRPELAAKEHEEIKLLEHYLPQTASDEDTLAIVHGAIAHLAEQGTKPGPKDIGAAMRVVQQRFMASGLHADNKKVSEMLKVELGK